MAMSMLQGRHGASSLLRYPWSSWTSKLSVRRTSGYYVLLPEIPPDTSADNTVMQFHDTPKFSSITPDRCVTGCAKLAIEYETQLGNHIEALKDISTEKTFERVFNPIEEVSVPLNTAWRTAKNLNYVAGSDHYRRAFTRIHPQVERAKNERWISETLYYACKEVEANSPNLTEFQRRLVSLYLLEGRLNGIELQGKEKQRFIEVLKILNFERSYFRNRVMLCQGMFSHTIDNYGDVSEMPRDILALMSEDPMNPDRGPWRVTLQQNVYVPFLAYCSDRSLRWNAWNAYNNRASSNFQGKDLANHKRIEKLCHYRKDIANMLGYDNFAEMSMETKMAGSVENVLNMIDALKGKFKPIAQEEAAELQAFAESQGFRDALQSWDFAYWRRRHREHVFQYDENQVSKYFPLETVLQGLFKLCNQLFGITIKESTGRVETWNEDIRFFELYDKQGQCTSSFFFDAFSQHANKVGRAWMEMGRERSELMGTMPYSYLNMNLQKPADPDAPVMMQFPEVLGLFHEFGHGLQQLMTKVPYSELAGQRNVEWDAVQVCARFMQRWPMEPWFLRQLSSHYQTGDPLPDVLLTQVLGSARHMHSLVLMPQLYLSAFDMEVHLGGQHWHGVMKRVWDDYMPLPLSREDNHPCAFTQIFSDEQSAAYYAHTWSDMIAADIFAAFREARPDGKGEGGDERVQALGARFADTFLSLGGGLPASEVFRRFRGRDPSLDALLEYLSEK